LLSHPFLFHSQLILQNQWLQLYIWTSIQKSEEQVLTKKIRITEEAYKCLEEARLPGEDFNDTLLRLIRRYDQIELMKRQKQILEEEDFLPLDGAKE